MEFLLTKGSVIDVFLVKLIAQARVVLLRCTGRPEFYLAEFMLFIVPDWDWQLIRQDCATAPLANSGHC